MKRFAVFLLPIVFVFQSSAQSYNSLLWKITKEGRPDSYLFGTYHLVGSDYLKEHSAVNNAFEESAQVVVELVVDSMAMMKLGMLSIMPDSSLPMLLDSADYALLKTKVKSLLGYDLAMFSKIKPAVISTMIAAAMAEKYTPADLKYAGEPLDMYFAQQGKKSGKQIVPLETVEEQGKLLYGEPLQAQAEALMELIKDEKETAEFTKLIVLSYHREDLNAIWNRTLEMGETYTGDMEKLFDERNKKWIPELEKVLDRGDAFIAVGALHLPGENGIIGLLKRQGYTITPVK